jgi:hypothetical protein
MHGPSEGIFFVMSLMIPILVDSLFVMMVVVRACVCFGWGEEYG